MITGPEAPEAPVVTELLNGTNLGPCEVFKRRLCFFFFSDLGDGVLRDVRVHGHAVGIPRCHRRRQNIIPRKLGYD